VRLTGHRPSALRLAGILVLLCAAVGAVTTYDAPAPREARDRTGSWVTSPRDPDRRLLRLDETRAAGPATARVRVDPDDRRQLWRGAGAAMTDASVELLGQASDGLRRLFDAEAPDGARLSWVRLPLTATDMSPETWTSGWDGTTASPAPEAAAATEMVAGLTKRQPDLQVVASPWTAPAWMKEPPGIRGGALRDEEVEEYAAMLVAQADELRSRGVPLAALTLGNEPGYSADYPTMTMTPAQQAALGALVGSRLHDRGLELWAVDHNWADRATYDEVLGGAPGAFDAAAFHCYAGSPGQMAGVGVPPIVTECTGTRDSWEGTFEWDAKHLLADSISAGSTGLMMWNLATDPRGGPRDEASSGGCADCRGLLSVEGNDVEAGPEFFVLAHVSRAADPGARVVGSEATPGLEVAAFRNPDATLGVVAFNGTGTERTIAIEVHGRDEVRRQVRAGELLTVRIPLSRKRT
jgi:glucosylceramidase